MKRYILSLLICCMVVLTACGKEGTEKNSSDECSFASETLETTSTEISDVSDENTEAASTEENEITSNDNYEIPENAVYCQTERSYFQGELTAVCHSYYNEYNDCVYVLSESEDGNTAIESSYFYEYNDDGTLSEMNMVLNGVQMFYQFEYSDDKRIKNETLYRNGKLWSTAVSEFDEHSNPLRNEISYLENENLNSVTTYEYEYDSEGRILVEKYISDKKYLSSTKRYTYDSNGNAVSLEMQYTDRDLTSLTKYTYNSDNRLIRKAEYIDGEELSYSEYEYKYY